MILVKFLKILLYLVLLTAALLFVRQTIREYKDGATSYMVTQEPVSLRDLPTLTLCWVRKYTNYNTSVEDEDELRSNVYGKNLSIAVRIFGQKENTVTLIENENVQAFNSEP